MNELLIAAQIVSKVLEIGLLSPTEKELDCLFIQIYKDLISPSSYKT